MDIEGIVCNSESDNIKDSYSCKTGMRGTVTCRPTVAYIEYSAVGIQ